MLVHMAAVDFPSLDGVIWRLQFVSYNHLIHLSRIQFTDIGEFLDRSSMLPL